MSPRGAALAAPAPAAARFAPFAAGQDASAQIAKLETDAVVEIHVCARPTARAGGFAAQARSAWENLLTALRCAGAGPGDILAEKVFFSDLPAQAAEARRIRAEVCGRERASAGDPALTFVQQPPAEAGRLLEIQAVAMLPGREGKLAIRPITGLAAGTSGRVAEQNGIRQIFLGGTTGGWPGDDLSVAHQAESMFRRAEIHLGHEGADFRDVVRTWIYLRDIDTDYGAFNLVRRSFFEAREVSPAPASTGIRGTPHPADRACGLDLRAFAGRRRVPVTTLTAPTMNEAPLYGADFSRGMRVALPDRAILYVSGTASIDEQGRIVAPDDFEQQVNRMLLNVELLLGGQGASWMDLVSAVTYLKRPGDLAAFRGICRRRGVPESIPHSVVAADICRPGWLCEMEAIAVLA